MTSRHKRRTDRGNFSVETPFVQLSRKMLESPAWRSLSRAALTVFFRLCIEDMHHAGTENGRLKCLYADFEQYGVRRQSVSNAVQELEALGFIEVVERGRMAFADLRVPSKYRLTFRPARLENGLYAAPTNEWQQLTAQQVAALKASVEARQPKIKRQGAILHLVPGAKTQPAS